FKPFGPVADVNATAERVVVKMRDGHMHLSSPTVGVLRFNCKRSERDRGNFKVSMLDLPAAPIRYESPNVVSNDQCMLAFNAEGGAQAAGAGHDGRLANLFE